MNKLIKLIPSAGALALALALPSIAQAQEAPEEQSDEIIVTGTSIRGVAPAGAQTIGLGEEDIAATGATSTAQVLATVPQLLGFNTTPAVAGRNNVQLTVNPVNLRNLPMNIGAASPTLVLMDNHRLVGVGVGQNYPDPDVVPPGALARVEIVTDGGSSVYGADAIGGVVNFITRTDFDGVEFDARVGMGEDYTSYDGYLTVGRDWGSGSGYISYSHSEHDSIYGHDRDYVRGIDWTTGIPLGRTCNPGSVVITGQGTWAINQGNPSTLTAGTGNACDLARAATIYPDEERNTIFVGLSQDLTSDIEFNLRGWHTRRVNESDPGPLQGNVTVANGNPNYVSTGGATATSTQQVNFDFSPVAGASTRQATIAETWGIAPSITWDLGHDWQMRALANYGHSNASFNTPSVNLTALQSAVNAGTINPYNIGLSDPAAITNALNWRQYGRGTQELTDFKVTFDGPTLVLPGGEVRVALGVEHMDQDFEGIRNAQNTPAAINALAPTSADRSVDAAFLEVNIPIVGDGNRITGIHDLALTLSARHDDYSDFGEVTSPYVGFTYSPVEWLTFRGHWNETFEAPGLADLANATSFLNPPAPSSTILSLVPFLQNPAVPYTPGRFFIGIQGTLSPLEPQEGDAYNIGFDLRPPVIPGLEIGVTYYNIEHTGAIGIPPSFNPAVFWSSFPNLYIMNPTNAQALAFMLASGVPNATATNALASVPDGSIYVVEDVRSRNLGLTQVDGYDLSIRYERDMPFGSLFAAFNGSYNLTYEQATSVNLPPNINFTGSTNGAGIDGLGGERYDFSATLGARFGENLLVQATLYERGPIKVQPSAANLQQTEIDTFDIVDLYARYNFGEGPLGDLSVSLGVNNVFDEEPPVYHGQAGIGGTVGYSGSTLGRVIQVGVHTQF